MDLQPQRLEAQLTGRRSSALPGVVRAPERPPCPLPAMAERLACHMDIAWDFDGTLVDHRAAPLLHRFIREHRHIRHAIVTFRTRAMARQVWSELGRYPGAPGRACFDRVLNIPDEAWDEVRTQREKRGFMRYLLPHSAAEWRYRRWKGLACQHHGFTALVDDMTAMVAAGCRRYDVALFHPADFLAS